MKKFILKFLCVACFLCSRVLGADSPSPLIFSPNDNTNEIRFAIVSGGYEKAIYKVNGIKRKIKENGTNSLVLDDESFSYRDRFVAYGKTGGNSEEAKLTWVGNQYYDDNRSEPQEFVVDIKVTYFDRGQEISSKILQKTIIMNPQAKSSINKNS